MSEEELAEILALILKSQEEHGKTIALMVQYINTSAELMRGMQSKVETLEAKVAKLEKIEVDKIVKDFFN